MNPSQRHKARYFAIQAIYQWQLAQQELPVLLEQFLEQELSKKMDKEYFSELVEKICSNTEEIDALLLPCLDRKINEVSQVELAILRVGAGEIMHRIDVPAKVVINEGVELAKTFGGEGSHKYINGVLDQFARNQRPNEFE
jgi:N utilization substance protein B